MGITLILSLLHSLCNILYPLLLQIPLKYNNITNRNLWFWYAIWNTGGRVQGHSLSLLPMAAPWTAQGLEGSPTAYLVIGTGGYSWSCWWNMYCLLSHGWLISLQHSSWVCRVEQVKGTRWELYCLLYPVLDVT